MVSTRWQKQNTSTLATGLAVTTVTAVLLAVLLSSLGLNRQLQIISVFVMLGGLGLTLALRRRNPNEMVRVLRFELEELERDFRMLFKDRHIRFYRQTEEVGYRYEFPGYSLTMTIKPFDLHNFGIDPEMQTPATHVRLREVSAKNEAFAGVLAEAIDEMASQLAHNRNSA